MATPNEPIEEDQNYPVVPSFTEAPAVIFTQLYRLSQGGQVVQLNLTVRGNSATEAIDGMLNAIRYAASKGLSVDKPTPGAAQPASNGAPAPVQQGQPPAQVAPPPPAGPAPVQKSNGNGAKPEQSMYVNKMVVTPLAGNAVTIQWFAPNHKWPDLKIQNWAVDSAVKLLAPTGGWTAQHLQVAGEHAVNCTVFYTLSDKLNQKGEPFKDVVRVSPA